MVALKARDEWQNRDAYSDPCSEETLNTASCVLNVCSCFISQGLDSSKGYGFRRGLI